MTLVSKAAVPCKKLARFGAIMFGKGFKSSKCKTMVRLAQSRIKLLRNKREIQVKQMRRDVAMLLESGQEATARIRVEHVIREQNVMAANEIIELFCELVVVRLPIIAKQRGCPTDLKEGISSLIFAAPRCSDIPELQKIRGFFEKKYGKDFVLAATELRPDCGVNRTLIEKLSVRTPTGEVKLKLMKEIAKEYQVDWDTTESELELLKPPEELLEGPRTFVSASSMPVKSMSMPNVGQNGSDNRSFNNRDINAMHFKDTASAAQAAAESAEKAVAAAQAAAHLANTNPHQISQQADFSTVNDGFRGPISCKHNLMDTVSGNSSESFVSSDPWVSKSVENFQTQSDSQSELPRRIYHSQKYERPRYVSEGKTDHTNLAGKNIYRRQHSYNVAPAHSDIRFDDSDGLDSDCDEESEMEAPPGGSCLPPDRPPPPLSRSHHANEPDYVTASDNSNSSKQKPFAHVHPNLPDYEALSARFEALKFRRSLD